jgi:hypothetical protein
MERGGEQSSPLFYSIQGTQMNYLKITLTDGTYKLYPEDQVIMVGCTANVMTGNVLSAGRITDVKHLDGAGAAAPTITSVAAITAYSGANTKYEMGCFTHSGTFDAYLRN